MRNLIMGVVVFVMACGGPQRPSEAQLRQGLAKCAHSDDRDIWSCDAARAACGIKATDYDSNEEHAARLECLHGMAVEVEGLRPAAQRERDEQLKREDAASGDAASSDPTEEDRKYAAALGRGLRVDEVCGDTTTSKGETCKYDYVVARQRKRLHELRVAGVSTDIKQMRSRCEGRGRWNYLECADKVMDEDEREHQAQQEQQERARQVDEQWQQEQALREQRRKARDSEPCTVANARIDVLDVAEDQERATIEDEHIDKGKYRMKVDNLHYHVGEPESDKVERRRQQCIDTRVAECQAKVDGDDLAGAAACWTQVHDRVDEASVNTPNDVQRCFDETVTTIAAVATCASGAERTDDEIIAKADCTIRKLQIARNPPMPQTLTPATRLNGLCGHMNIAKYVDRQLAANFDGEVSRLEAKAKEPRARIGARDSVCKARFVIEFEEKQLDHELAVEREGGVVDLGSRRQIAETLVLFKQQYQRALTDYRHVWKRAFSQARDCKPKP